MESLSTCKYIYDPTTTPRDCAKFFIHFDKDKCMEAQKQRSNRVVNHLRLLNSKQLQDESAQFFKWLILHNLSPCNREYARNVLAFFHASSLLLGKSTVDNPIKQLKHRYLVVFSMGRHVFAKRYNSIRELKADTGKRPSQIHKQKKDLVCHNLLVS